MQISRSVESSESGSATVMHVKGNIDGNSMDNFIAEVKIIVQEMRDSDSVRLVISLQDVEYINSSGLAILVWADKRIAKAKSLFVANLTDKIEHIIKVIKFDQHIRNYDTIESALEAMEG